MEAMREADGQRIANEQLQAQAETVRDDVHAMVLDVNCHAPGTAKEALRDSAFVRIAECLANDGQSEVLRLKLHAHTGERQGVKVRVA